MTTILIKPIDPIIARDSRKFGIGNKMRCLEWLYPSVTTGTIRTLLGKIYSNSSKNPFKDDNFLSILKDVSVSWSIAL